ncbi:MAG: AraC family transcriptional regulator [Oscillospiraceae bacterium]|nr:AraC family transcriptional regulator [Oscillospiraceae bacterium]
MRYFYAYDKNLPDFFVCGNLINENGFVHCRRNFDVNVLILVLEGTLFITQSERRFEVSEGQYIFLKAGEEHYGHRASKGKLSYMWVHFRNSIPWDIILSDDIPAFPKSFSYFLPEYGTCAGAQRANILFYQLMDFSRHERLYSKAMLSCSLNLILMEITQEFIDSTKRENSHNSSAVYNASEWIKSNCHKQITIHDIAEAMHYNAEYLSALFKKETGFTLVQYLNKTRIEISKKLLSGNNISIKEAAYSCGFPNEKYYMKIFKRFEGVTPMQYKNAFYKKNIN